MHGLQCYGKRESCLPSAVLLQVAMAAAVARDAVAAKLKKEQS